MPVYKGGKQYTAEDMRHVYERRQWRSWDQMISWLESEGRNDPEIMDSKVGQLIFQLKQLRDKDIPFVSNYLDAFKLAQEHNSLHGSS
jgi:hypothetical protein